MTQLLRDRKKEVVKLKKDLQEILKDGIPKRYSGITNIKPIF